MISENEFLNTFPTLHEIDEIPNIKIRESYKLIKNMLMTGEKITKNKIATSISYSPSNLSEPYKSEHWKNLAASINRISANNHSNKHKTELSILREKRNEWKEKYFKLVSDEANVANRQVDFKRRLNDYIEKYTELQRNYDQLFLDHNKVRDALSSIKQAQHSDSHSSKLANLSKVNKAVISTDEEHLRLTGGFFDWEDIEIVSKAHKAARIKLLKELSRPVPSRLYITVGLPCSGKSTWVNQHTPPDSKRCIYYDSTANDMIRRGEIILEAKSHYDCTVCLVYFDIDRKLCIQRNEQRQTEEHKYISEAYIDNFRVDPPSIKEQFDEMIIIRSY
ncbi:hypothetical protein [Vibrio diazotrophicus]|uniref:hypothetical protein n=1 Tax=Vibrio diazotrophicus TaxID=685 RepID=UPI000C9DA914|nr:hypothetical protein [Vibrio diazotrophicus]PNH83420.1 hypothetical protein C1N27_02255 [Vibrio diazotrophicus]